MFLTLAQLTVMLYKGGKSGVTPPENRFLQNCSHVLEDKFPTLAKLIFMLYDLFWSDHPQGSKSEDPPRNRFLENCHYVFEDINFYFFCKIPNYGSTNFYVFWTFRSDPPPTPEKGKSGVTPQKLVFGELRYGARYQLLVFCNLPNFGSTNFSGGGVTFDLVEPKLGT